MAFRTICTLIWLILGYLLIYEQGVQAYRTWTFDVEQMRLQYLLPGIPITKHGGIVSDVFVLTPLLGILVAGYCDTWTRGEVAKWFVIGVVASFVLHQLYKMAEHPEAHVLNHTITTAGYLHMVYMALAISIILLFYFSTPGVSAWVVWTSTALLIIHVMFGTHLVTALLHPWWFPYLKVGMWVQMIGTVVACATALVVRSWLMTH